MSAYEQHVDTCAEHEECEVIVCTLAGVILWESHAHKDTHVGCRLGDQLPEAVDKRTGETHTSCEMCDHCREAVLGVPLVDKQ